MKAFKALGSVLILASIGLSLYWYDWKLAVILFLFVRGNNLERTNR